MPSPRSSPPACPYQLLYRPQDSGLPDERTLARVRFGAAAATDDPRDIVVPLPQLQGAPQMEIWRSGTPVRTGRRGALGFAHNGEVLFGQFRADDAALADCERTAYEAYREIEALMQAQKYPGWLRVWIYLAGIHDGEGDGERYRAFCAGRHRALARRGFETWLPAATAIGTRTGGLLIYFLAAREPGAQVENPRQMSAFRYPREYGPVGPSFSRATLKRWRDRTQLFVSGTASIVGHESRHPDDPAAQLGELSTNIRALVQQARETHALGEAALRPEGIKLYLRDRALLPPLTADIRRLSGTEAPLLILEGDICRRELLVEAEVSYTLP